MNTFMAFVLWFATTLGLAPAPVCPSYEVDNYRGSTDPQEICVDDGDDQEPAAYPKFHFGLETNISNGF